MPATAIEPDPVTSSSLGRLWRKGGRWALALALGVGMVLAVAWGLLLFQILPRAADWRDDLAQQATQALGVPVRVGALEGRREGLWPVLVLRQVQLLSGDGRPELTLPEVHVRLSLSTLSPWAWLDGRLRLGELVLVAPDLSIRRDRDGVMHIAGWRLDPAAPAAQGAGDTSAADWVLTQARIRIERGRIQWHDQRLNAPPLSLTDVTLDVRNRLGMVGRQHDWVVQATPPADVGERFELRADVHHSWWSRPSDWRAWSGDVTGQWPRVDVRRWQEHVRLPVEVMSGAGRVGGSLSLEAGRLAQAALDVDVRDVRIRWQPGLPTMVLRQLQGHWRAQQAPDRTTVGWDDLQMTLEDGQRWPTGSAELSWRHEPLAAGQAWPVWAQTLGGDARASALDLHMLASLADRLPLPAEWREALRAFEPAGVLRNLALSWQGPPGAPGHYTLSGQAQGLRLQPAGPGGQRPGLGGADVQFSLDERQGKAQVQVQQGWLAFPGVFEEPKIPVDRLQAQVAWQQRDGQWAVQVREATFANGDAQGSLRADWRTSRPGERDAAGRPLDALPGWLTMTGQLDTAQATRVWRYLPLTIPADTRHYVRDAFTTGVGEAVTFEVDGELNAFPFKDDVGGRFRVNVPLQGVTMAYVPPSLLGLDKDATHGVWAPLSDLKGVLRFEGQRMLVSQATGRLATVGAGQFVLKDVEGRIDNLGDDDPRLTVNGQGRGALEDALQFLARSPISAWTGHALDDARAHGQVALSLGLDIPLMRTDDTRVRGQLILGEQDMASLKLNPDVPWLSMLRGQIDFTEQTLDVRTQGRVWGETFTVQGQRGDDGIARFKATGRMGARGLSQAQDYPLLARLGPMLTGDAPVQVQVEVGEARVRQGQPLAEVLVQSSLQGVQSSLPAPMTKAAQAVWPLRVRYTMPDASGNKDALQIDLGNPAQSSVTSAAMPWVRADLQMPRTLAMGGARAARNVRGTMSVVQVGGTEPTRLPAMPERGLQAQLVLDRLDLDAWTAMARQWAPSPPVTPLPMGVGGVAGGARSDGADGFDALPDTINLRVDTLTWRQRSLHQVNATLAHPAPRVWRLQLDAREAAGVLEWLPDEASQAGVGAQKLVARLQRLTVPAADAEAISAQAVQGLMQTDTTTSVPALDIAVEDFDWRGLSLGRFEMQAVNRRIADGSGRQWPEWRLTRFRLGGAEAQLNAQGNWTVADGAAGRSRSAFSFTLDVNNGGDLLARLGWPKTVRGARGQLSGHVAWRGSPLDLDTATMTGDVKVRFSQGQFLKVDPGAAKLLGVLSLQSLPRRLALDFRDLFQEGFAFDAIDGDLQIQQGVASTRNLRMRGVQAVVLMEGQANLGQETQDLQVYVVPDVNAGAASLAYAAINPVVGLGTFVAQMLLRKQVAEAGTQAFRITGAWNDPQVTRVLSAKELTVRSDAAQSEAAKASSP